MVCWMGHSLHRSDGAKTRIEMKTLEKQVALNASYRRLWQNYYARFTSAELNEKLQNLVNGMDSESRELCSIHAELAPYFFPHPLLEKALLPGGARLDFLPPKTIDGLAKAGFFSEEQASIDKLQRELDLPFEPLPELLLHSGLQYMPKMARHWIKDKTIIDGGAFKGDTAKLFLRYYAPKVIFAVEPSRDSFEELRKLVTRWQVKDRIKPLRYVLSDSVGSETLWGTGVGASVVKKVADGDLSSETIQSSTIDTLISEYEIQNIGLIKLDVEGNELPAIKGAIETIRRDRPLLLISIYHTATDFFEIKPFIEGMNLGYRFLVRKVSDDLLKELVLICMPNNGEI